MSWAELFSQSVRSTCAVAGSETVLRNPNVNADTVSPALPPVGVTVGLASLPSWIFPNRAKLAQPAIRVYPDTSTVPVPDERIAHSTRIRSSVVLPANSAGVTDVLSAWEAAPAAT